MTTAFERQDFPFSAPNLCVNSNSMRQQLWLQSEFQQPQHPFQEAYISQPFDSFYGAVGAELVEPETTGNKRKHVVQMDSRSFKKPSPKQEFMHEEQWLDGYENMLGQDKSQDPFIQYLDFLGADCQGAFHLMDNTFRPKNLVKKESFSSDISDDNDSESIGSDFDLQDKKRRSKTRQKRTKWSTTELYHLWVGIQTHGNEWREVKHSVGSRTYPQVKDKGRRLLQTEQWVTGKTKRDTESAKEIAKDIATEVLRRYSMTGRLSN